MFGHRSPSANEGACDSPGHAPHPLAQRIVGPLPRAVLRPQVIVVLDVAIIRKLAWQRAPLTSALGAVKNRVHNFAQIHVPFSSRTRRLPGKWINDIPLRVTTITLIPFDGHWFIGSRAIGAFAHHVIHTSGRSFQLRTQEGQDVYLQPDF